MNDAICVFTCGFRFGTGIQFVRGLGGHLFQGKPGTQTHLRTAGIKGYRNAIFEDEPSCCFYPGRTARCHCHHRHPHRPVATGGADRAKRPCGCNATIIGSRRPWPCTCTTTPTGSFRPVMAIWIIRTKTAEVMPNGRGVGDCSPRSNSRRWPIFSTRSGPVRKPIGAFPRAATVQLAARKQFAQSTKRRLPAGNAHPILHRPSVATHRIHRPAHLAIPRHPRRPRGHQRRVLTNPPPSCRKTKVFSPQKPLVI